MDDGCRAIIEGMGQRERRMNPFQTVLFQGQRPKEGSGYCHRMNRGANIVDETWQSEFGGAGTTTNLWLRFHDQDGPARLRHDDGGGQPVWPRSNDNRVVARESIQWIGFWLY